MILIFDIHHQIERLMFRQGVELRAQHYSVAFLNQIVLTARERRLAIHLMEVYFGMFKILIAKGEMESRLLSLLLTGVNRALPFAAGTKHQQDLGFLYFRVSLVADDIQYRYC